jgi:peptidoglycan/LPS O-acetylase OafA/YrhL
LTYPQQEMGAGLAAGVLLVGLVIASPAAPLNRLLSLRPIVWLGTISYGIYLYFIPVIVLLNVFFYYHGWTDRDNALLWAQIGCTLTMATLSYYLVERRFLALKDRLNDRQMRRKPQHARGRTRDARRSPTPLETPIGTSANGLPSTLPVDGAASYMSDDPDLPVR